MVRPCELVRCRPQASHTEVEVRSDDGAKQTIRALWLVGCDGMHSTVREQSGVAFTGAVYEQSFVLADVRMDWPLSRKEVTLFYSPDGLVVVAPLPEEHFRIVATVDQAPEVPSAEYMQAVLDRRGPTEQPGRIREVVWGSRFRIHHRIAETRRLGRILLCGDAAHVHSLAGGQGMNTGIQDSVSLAEALTKTLSDRDESRLDALGARAPQGGCRRRRAHRPDDQIGDNEVTRRPGSQEHCGCVCGPSAARSRSRGEDPGGA